MSLTIGSLFAGVGGLELGLEWAGLGPTLWQIERDRFCNTVLAKHWPEAVRFDDVCTVGAAELAPVDLICGGFPCQDVSSAGKGAGLAGERSGLWREFARIVSELRAEWVVVENVTSGAERWLDAVVRDLEQLGYACLPVPMSASDVGAPHRRARLFVVAANAERGRLRIEQGRCSRSRGAGKTEPGNARSDGVVANANGARQLQPGGSDSEQWRRVAHSSSSDADNARREGTRTEAHTGRLRFARHPGWSSQSGLVPLVHGLSGGLAGRRRRARIRALGNAVVPQCAEVVGWVIRELMTELRATNPSAS